MTTVSLELADDLTYEYIDRFIAVKTWKDGTISQFGYFISLPEAMNWINNQLHSNKHFSWHIEDREGNITLCSYGENND